MLKLTHYRPVGKSASRLRSSAKITPAATDVFLKFLYRGRQIRLVFL